MLDAPKETSSRSSVYKLRPQTPGHGLGIALFSALNSFGRTPILSPQDAAGLAHFSRSLARFA